MRDYTSLKFTHAFLKEADDSTPRPVFLTAGAIAGFHRGSASDPTKLVIECTHVYTIGGIFPVTETVEQVAIAMNNLNNQSNQGAASV